MLSLALPPRGFTAHVLGYTLHACLQVRGPSMHSTPHAAAAGAPVIMATARPMRSDAGAKPC